MSVEQDRLSKVLTAADDQIEKLLLKAYRIGFFDGHMNGTNFQREELVSLIEESLAELYGTDASEDPIPRGRMTPLSGGHPALAGVNDTVGHNVRLWAEFVGPA